MSMLSTSLDLAADGWAVFPCIECGREPKWKSPYTAHGHHDATTDPPTIRAWWTRWPTAMIGAPVPVALLVLDLDPRNGGSIAEMEALCGPLPPTLTTWSGRGDGGRHLYFRRPAGTLTGTRLPAGWDLRVNGYCIMPPSLHPATGEPYRWLDDRAPVALPDAVRALLRPMQIVPRVRPHRATGPHGDGGALVTWLARQQHNVNDALFWAACRAVDAGILTDAFAAELVAAAGEAAGPRATYAGERQSWRTIGSARSRNRGVA
ncbi:MAG: bifunctional DNA primase/polymerase [Mycobacterium sp.]